MVRRIHSEECATSSRQTKCYDCFNIHFNAVRRELRARKKLDKIQTRNVVNKTRSKYHEILCSECKDKTKTDYCSTCKKFYDNAKAKKSRIKKKESKQSSGSSCDSNNISNNNSGMHGVTSQNCAKK